MLPLREPLRKSCWKGSWSKQDPIHMGFEGREGCASRGLSAQDTTREVV
jgi:hypothetical protein